MSISEMRKFVTEAYPGADWPHKVIKMTDTQVAAIYQRLIDKKRLKDLVDSAVGRGYWPYTSIKEKK